MKVKIDTKEKFHVLTIQNPTLSANMTEELHQELLLFLKNELKNVVLNMAGVMEIDELAAHALFNIQQKFYNNNASFVICALNPAAEQHPGAQKFLAKLNITPTESEAWDIVQLEEIERELME